MLWDGIEARLHRVDWKYYANYRQPRIALNDPKRPHHAWGMASPAVRMHSLLGGALHDDDECSYVAKHYYYLHA